MPQVCGAAVLVVVVETQADSFQNRGRPQNPDMGHKHPRHFRVPPAMSQIDGDGNSSLVIGDSSGVHRCPGKREKGHDGRLIQGICNGVILKSWKYKKCCCCYCCDLPPPVGGTARRMVIPFPTFVFSGFQHFLYFQDFCTVSTTHGPKCRCVFVLFKAVFF